MLKINPLSQSKFKQRMIKHLMSKKELSTAMALAYNSGINIKNKNSHNVNFHIESLSLNDLLLLIARSKNNIENCLKIYLPNYYQGKFNLFYNKNEYVSKDILSKLQKEYLNYKNSCLEKQKKMDEKFELPFIKEKINFSENFTPILYHDDNAFYSHSRVAIKKIVGENTINDVKKIEKYAKLYSGENYINLLKRKLNLSTYFLDKLQEFAYNPESDESDIKKIKSAVLKYDSIKMLLNAKGIYSDNIETLILNNSSKKSSKNFNDEIVLKDIKILDRKEKKLVSATVTFANTDKGLRFRIYNTDYDSQNLESNYLHNLRTNNLTQINQVDLKINKFLKDNKIAEVVVEKLDKKGLYNKMIDSKVISEDEIKKYLSGEEDFFYIKNLQNFNLKKYYNVTKSLMDVLIQFAKLNNIKSAYTEAQAFNGVRQSPASLYFYLGCEPISMSTSELKNKIRSNQLDYKENIWFKYTL